MASSSVSTPNPINLPNEIIVRIFKSLLPEDLLVIRVLGTLWLAEVSKMAIPQPIGQLYHLSRGGNTIVNLINDSRKFCSSEQMIYPFSQEKNLLLRRKVIFDKLGEIKNLIANNQGASLTSFQETFKTMLESCELENSIASLRADLEENGATLLEKNLRSSSLTPFGAHLETLL